jgi:hypothetical protein
MLTPRIHKTLIKARKTPTENQEREQHAKDEEGKILSKQTARAGDEDGGNVVKISSEDKAKCHKFVYR